jgi:hypothetical protein
MKKFFLIPLMTLAFSVMAIAQEKVFLGVNGLSVALNDGLEFALQVPASKSLDAGTLNIEVRVSDDLLVDAPRERSVSLQTGLNATVDLNEKLSNAYAFEGSQMVVSVKADGTTESFLYNITRDNNVISAIANDAKDAEAAWALALSQIEKTANPGSDSYIKIANGSFIQLGGKKLQFAEINMMKGNWGMESLRQDLNAKSSMVSPNGEGSVLFIAKGSEFAVGGSKVIALENITITLENDKAFAGDLQDLKDAFGQSAENTIREFIGLANDLIGNIDAAAANYLTINVGDAAQALQPEDADIPEEGEWTAIRSDVDFSLDVDYFFTVCLPYEVTSYRGGTFFEIEEKDGDNNELVLISVEKLVAGVPYVCVPRAAIVEGKIGAGRVTAPREGRGLVGTFENTAVPYNDPQSPRYFAFNKNVINPCLNPCFMAAHRAYIDMQAVEDLEPYTPRQAAGRRRLRVGGNNAPTAIDEVAGENAANKKMIVNGQLIIVRDGVKYNAQGAIVK